MTTKGLVLVSGANGHLGNNLVRLLLQKGYRVRASVRNLHSISCFEGLNCEVVQADITDKVSFIKALEGVETFYAVGASFKLWAKNPKKEIYDVNIQGTQYMLEAAAETGVKRVVYVSSIAALNYTQLPTHENNGYNLDRRDWYYNSKNDGEQLAFQLAKKLKVDLISVMPSAMIGGEASLPLNVSYGILKLILTNKIPLDTKITLNWIDVKDVAEGCYLAAERGRTGERYILANETCMTLTDTTKFAQTHYPELKLKIPQAAPKFILYVMAGFMQLTAKISGKPPLLTIKDIAMFSGLQQNFDISKARNELTFQPKPTKQALIEAFDYLMQHPSLFK